MKKIFIPWLFSALFLACQSSENKSNQSDSAKTISGSAKDSLILPTPGPIPNSTMTKEYVYQMGRQIYFWAWPLVNLHNRAMAMSKVQEAGLNGGAVPVAPLNHLCMLTDYITPGQRYVACPNQDVVYGGAFLDLSKGPVILQIPDFGNRFWVCQMGNQRTEGIGQLGAMYGSRKGFYMIAASDWKGEVPKAVEKVFRSSTNIAYAFPRVFMNNDPEDRKALQPIISQLNTYPLSAFDGGWKIMDWSKIPKFPDPLQSQGGKEVAFVIPEKFFEELPAVMTECPPMKGEEALYVRYKYVLDAADKDPVLKASLNKAAMDAEKDLIDPLRQFKNTGIPAGHYWNTVKNGAAWGTDYLNRTGAARSNIFVNQPNETMYFNQDRDSSGADLSGNGNYSITFSRTSIPHVKGFWSLTVYDANHFFYQNPDKIYSLGTKNKNLHYNEDGSLTLFLQNQKPAGQMADNWLPTPKAKFGLLLRAYWPEESMVQEYLPPLVIRRK